MKKLRSILELINHIKANRWLIEAQNRWKKASLTDEYSWFLLFLMLIMPLSSIFWVQQQVNQSRILSFNADRVKNMRSVQKDTLRLGAKRLMGTPSPVSQMPERVQIQAILYNPEPSAREVLLMDATGQVKSYRIGDKLPGQSVVISIERQSIEIERGGHRNQLKFNQYPNTFISDTPLQPNNSILQ
jgi:hypothetical protein